MRLAVIIICGILTVSAHRAYAGEAVTNQKDSARSVTATNRINITTLSGITYTNCELKRAEPNGITIIYSRGIAKIPFTDLPEEYRSKYDYNPTNADAYARAVYIQQYDARIRQQDSLQKQREQASAETARSDAEAAMRHSVVQPASPPKNVAHTSGDEYVEVPPAQNVTIIIPREKSKSELRGDMMLKGQEEAAARKSVVRRVGESQESFAARQKAAVDAVRKKWGPL